MDATGNIASMTTADLKDAEYDLRHAAKEWDGGFGPFTSLDDLNTARDAIQAELDRRS